MELCCVRGGTEKKERKARGWHFLQGKSDRMLRWKSRREREDGGRDESADQQPSTLFSPPFISLHFPHLACCTSPSFPHQHHHQTCSASSHGWSALRFPSAGGEKHLYPGSPARLHVLIKRSSVRTDSVITTSAIQALYDSPETRGGRKIKHLLFLSMSLLCSHGFLLSYKGNCQEELFTINCLKYKHRAEADYCICWQC